MNGIIIYKSKYGATKQYAEWLGKSLNFPVVMEDEVAIEELEHCDIVLLGTSVYYGKFKNADWMKQNVQELSRKKKIIIFVVTATSENEKETRKKFLLENVPREIESRCEFHFLPGRIIHQQLSLTDKVMLKIAGFFEKDPEKKRAMHEDLDGVKKENLELIINSVSRYSKKAYNTLDG